MQQQLIDAAGAFKGGGLACTRALPAALRLRLRAKAMSYHLRLRGVRCSMMLHYRDPRVAHRWSTAYAIMAGEIALATLRDLPEGRDADGNLWYRPEWEAAGAQGERAADCPDLLENAARLGPPNGNYAEEGYGPTDPRRWPNGPEVPVSRHIDGRAIDLWVDWAKLGGPWSEESLATVARFGLTRPYRHEEWHLELLEDGSPQFSLAEALTSMIRSKLRQPR